MALLFIYWLVRFGQTIWNCYRLLKDKPAPKKTRAPFGKKTITGMSQDFSVPIVAEYYYETNFAPQPKTMSQLPMSLWNVALEVHSGRIFIGNITTYIFIFVMHFFAIWCLWSDYRI